MHNVPLLVCTFTSFDRPANAVADSAQGLPPKTQKGDREPPANSAGLYRAERPATDRAAIFFCDRVVCGVLGSPFGGPKPRPLGARIAAEADAAKTTLDTPKMSRNPPTGGVSRGEMGAPRPLLSPCGPCCLHRPRWDLFLERRFYRCCKN